ncbi:hypothetical protein, partial [Pseudomonas sp. MWU13-3659]|uniref:hypothetical protein n=1 Tax=Pseudomonas sp. MWU13-3659 TaxID=2986964 RepID=UPI002074B988
VGGINRSQFLSREFNCSYFGGYQVKLIGGLAEQAFREELSKSWDGLRSKGCRVLSTLQNRQGDINSAFVLSSTPEQAEDLYTIMVNGVDVVWLETIRGGVGKF